MILSAIQYIVELVYTDRYFIHSLGGLASVLSAAPLRGCGQCSNLQTTVPRSRDSLPDSYHFQIILALSLCPLPPPDTQKRVVQYR